MESKIKTIQLSQVVFDESIYPRREHNPSIVQQYEEHLDEIEARKNFISIAEDMTLLDGRHRQLAYLKRARSDGQEDKEIQVFVFPVTEKREKYALACELNSDHGLQPSVQEKKTQVLRLYSEFSYELAEIAKMVSVRYKSALDWTKTIRDNEKRLQDEKIFEMWLSCHTSKEIESELELDKSTVSRRLKGLLQKVPGNFSQQSYSTDSNWKPPLYDVWAFAKGTNRVSHNGNSEVRIVDNLLYLYTEPFDIVIDPFAGGGSTIDVCKKRLRRYWVSDLNPIVEREHEIRTANVLTELPGPYNAWKDVSFVYLDPPYWRQALGMYGDSPDNLANMELEKFYNTLVNLISRYADKMYSGSHIALIIQPTQWNAPERKPVDHIFDIMIKLLDNQNLKYSRRISVPYSTHQYNPQQVNWAKENKDILVITREIIIFEVV